MLTFTVVGQPVGKQRPRVTRRGHSYTPIKTVNYETLVKEMFAYSYPRFEPLNDAIRVELDIYLQITRTDLKSKKKSGLMLENKIRPTKKPDIDNIIKAILDALNGIAYADDNQIVEVVAKKFYAVNPRVEIRIEAVK